MSGVEYLEAKILDPYLTLFNAEQLLYKHLEVVLDFDQQICSLLQSNVQFTFLPLAFVFAENKKELICHIQVSLKLK